MTIFTRFNGFLPYILIVFLNAFVDLGHKIIIQNTIFKIWDGEVQVTLTAIINAFILLPFILLFSPSGFLSDRFPKHHIVRYGALAAIIVTSLITFSYFMGWFWMAFGLTLLLAVQSAIYSPAKYGYIRELVGDKSLAEANAVVQAVTIVSILAGTFVFSAFFEMLIPDSYSEPKDLLVHLTPLGFALVTLSILEWFASLKLKACYEGDSTRQFEFRRYFTGSYLSQNLKNIKANRSIWLSIIGLSMFWAISQVVLASFPAHAKENLEITNTLIVQGILACTGIGIMLGSLIAGRVSRQYIEVGLVPLGALTIGLALFALPIVSNTYALMGIFTILGICGGIYIVPLNAMIQYNADEDDMGTVLAGNNWVQNVVMLSFLIMTVVFSQIGLNSTHLFAILAVVAMAGAVFSVTQLPHALARILVGAIVKRRFSIEVAGFDHLPKSGGVLLLGNHISWIDWAIVQLACPRPLRFVMIRNIYELWYLKPFFKFFGAIPISPGNSQESLETVNKLLKQGEVVCLFPEGAISHNGHLGEFKTGYERTVEGVDGVIVPFFLRGLWGSRLSRSRSEKLRDNTKLGSKRHLHVVFGDPLPIKTKAPELKQAIAALSIDAWQLHTQNLDPVPLAWLKTAKSDLGAINLIDTRSELFPKGRETSNTQAIATTLKLARIIKQQSASKGMQQSDRVGILLPASSSSILANMAVMMRGNIAVNLDWTLEPHALIKRIEQCEVDTIYTHNRFIKSLETQGEELIQALASKHIVYLDKAVRSNKASILGYQVLARILPAGLLYRLFGKPCQIDDTAQIVYSSGRTGNSKAVLLSHRNLMGNIKQISNVFNTQTNDIIMSSLAPCYSPGLTITSLLPMVEGIPAICHPVPEDVEGIAKTITRYQANILCSTSSLLNHFTENEKVHALMLDSLRLVIAGSDSLLSDDRHAFEIKFKKTIYTGYGTTETTPVASLNIPDRLATDNWKPQIGHKIDSVGLPLPGTSVRIIDAETKAILPIDQTGSILVSGAQVMQGYLNDESATEKAMIEIEGRKWFNTGDTGYLDKDGFLTLTMSSKQ